MRKSLITIIGAGFLLLPAALASAGTLFIDPSDQAVSVGGTANASLVIAGLGGGTSPSLSAFDVDITFDDSVLSFLGFTFGDPIIGDQLDLFGLGSVTGVTVGTGTVNLFQLSFDAASDLDALQAGSFILGTLAFQGLSGGSSAVGVQVTALADANGDPLTADVLAGRIVVGAAPVPEPATPLLLVVAGIVMCAVTRQKRR
jgi:hypothetical protein